MESDRTATSPANVWGTAAAPSTKSVWGSPVTPQTVSQSFKDVMSEELAKELQEEEDGISKVKKTISEDVDPDLLQYLASDAATVDTKDDFLMAQMLQHEFDKQHDAMISAEEKKFNGTNKVTITFDNYRSVHPKQQETSSDSDDDYWPVEDTGPHVVVPAFNKAGVSGSGKNIITKHDPNICGRKNLAKVMDTFPPEFETGDARKEIRLPNHVYNKLKKHSIAESKKAARLHEKKEHSTAEHAVDQRTRLILYKLVNNEILEGVNGVISTGKESVVFHATGGSMNTHLVPEECALKVYKTTLTEFKNRAEYVKGDFRLCRDEFKKQNPRKIMKLWAEKEHLNLRSLEKAGIPCPKAVILKKHILVMSFIGRDQVPAPKLKEAQLSVADAQIAYDQCVQHMKTMYQRCGLVHGDLSEYNMLWHRERVHFIDVSQSVEKMHPKAEEFLLRDCENVCNFFSKLDVHDVISPYQLFNEITGLGLSGETKKDFLAQVEEYEKNAEKLTLDEGREYAFDHFFEKAQKERQQTVKTKESVQDDVADQGQ